MDTILPISVCCLWHLLVLGAGLWIGHNRPWRWKIVQDPQTSHEAAAGQNSRYQEEEYDVFTRAR